MRHAIEEEEKVPMEQVTNFQEVTLQGAERNHCHVPCLVDWLLPVACLLRTCWCWYLGPETEDTGSHLVGAGDRTVLQSLRMTRLREVGEFHKEVEGSSIQHVTVIGQQFKLALGTPWWADVGQR